MSAIRSTPSSSTSGVDATTDDVHETSVSSELAAELLQAMAEIDRGEYIELTFQQLDRAAATGEWPWPNDESLD